MATAKMEANLAKQIRATLAELGGKAFADDDILYHGEKTIVLPVGMALKDAQKFLARKEAEQEEVTQFIRKFNFRPWDGAYCAYQALKKAFGAVLHKGTEGFFSTPPQMISLETDYDQTEQIPWGQLEVPMLPGVIIHLHSTGDQEYGPIFVITAEGPKKYAFEIEGIFRLVEEELRNHSIYKGKAIDGKDMPSFLNLKAVDPEKVVYTQSVRKQMDANIYSLIRFSASMRDNGVPLKRSALLYGPYGCIYGDAMMGVNRAGKGFQIPLRNLVTRYNGTDQRYAWDSSIETYVQREQDGVMRLAKVTGAWESGIKQTYTVLTDSGRTIRATDEHPFLTDDGWKRLDELQEGTMVHVLGGQGANGRVVKPRYAYTHVPKHPFAKANGVVAMHRLVVEAAENSLSFDDYVALLKAGETSDFTVLDPAVIAVHHLDGDSYNNELSNLAPMLHTDHFRTHAFEHGTMNNVLYRIESEMVVSVEPYGEEMTYDIEVEDEPHNFIADGFVVHNTGKTLAGFLIAQEAVGHHWGFIYVRPNKDNVFQALQTARMYAPCVVFFEDVDTIANPENMQADDVSRLLDEFDGIIAKGSEVIVVMTTNYPEKLHKGMLRPGRLDAVIKIAYLGDDDVQKLCQQVLPESVLADDVDWVAVAKSMHEFTPAFVKEAADRAFRSALSENGGVGENVKLETLDFCAASDSLRNQLELMEAAPLLEQPESLTMALRREVSKPLSNLARRVWDEEVDVDELSRS